MLVEQFLVPHEQTYQLLQVAEAPGSVDGVEMAHDQGLQEAMEAFVVRCLVLVEEQLVVALSSMFQKSQYVED